MTLMMMEMEDGRCGEAQYSHVQLFNCGGRRGQGSGLCLYLSRVCIRIQLLYLYMYVTVAPEEAC